jgi:hypothetical protein
MCFTPPKPVAVMFVKRTEYNRNKLIGLLRLQTVKVQSQSIELTWSRQVIPVHRLAGNR